MEKVIRDGKVAVLYSPGYGAGWFTWNTDHKDLLFHPDLVVLVEEDKRDEITSEFVQNLLGVEDVYCGGAEQLKIEWLEVGTSFRVDEYDGYESIITVEELVFTA